MNVKICGQNIWPQMLVLNLVVVSKGIYWARSLYTCYNFKIKKSFTNDTSNNEIIIIDNYSNKELFDILRNMDKKI